MAATCCFKRFPVAFAATLIALLSGCATAQYDSVAHQHKTFSASQSFYPTDKVDVDAGALLSTVTYKDHATTTGTWVKFNNNCKLSHVGPALLGHPLMAYQYFKAGEELPVSGVVTIKNKNYHIVDTDMQHYESNNNVVYWSTVSNTFLVNDDGAISSSYLEGVNVGLDTAKTDCSVSLLKNHTHITNVTNKVSVYYMGRTNSGFIKIGVNKSQNSVNIPAEPGVYSISDVLPGYKVKVYGTSRFRATLQLEKGATVE